MGNNYFSIGGVLMSGSEKFQWPFTTGPFSPSVQFTTSAKAAARLELVPNPVKIEAQVFRREGTKGRSTLFDIENLFLQRSADIVRMHRTRWFLTDIRWFLQRVWVAVDFGISRPANEFIKLTKDARGDFNRAAKRHFLPHTIRRRGTLRFANNLTPDEELEHWTALEAVKYMLSGFFSTQRGRVTLPDGSLYRPKFKVDPDVVDNKRLLINFTTNQHWPFTMRRLLAMAHVGIYVDPTGTFRVFSLDPKNLPSKVGGYTGAGVPTSVVRIRERPRNPRVHMRRDNEIRLNFFERVGEGSATVTRESAGLARINGNNLENVVILPQDVRDAATGQVFQRGQIVEIRKALELWRNDPDNPPPPLLNRPGRYGIDLDTIRRHVLTGSLATLWVTSLAKQHRRNELWASRVKTVYTSYRRVFRVIPELLDMIATFKKETGSIVDPVTGKRSPEAVWMDHFRIPSSRIKTPKGYQTGANKLRPGRNVYAWDGNLQAIDDPKALPLDGTPVAPAKVNFIDKRQGLFSVDFLPDIYGDTLRFIRGTFEDHPFFQMGYLVTSNAKYLTQMEQEELWRLSVLLSVTFRVPNDQRRNEIVEVSDVPGYTAPAALGPEVDIFFGSHHAIRTWRDGQSEFVVNADGQLELQGNELANESTVQDLARGVFDDLFFRFEDRVIGVFRARGFEADVDRPTGSVRGVTVEYDGRKGSLESVYDATALPTPPPFWELLPPNTQRILYRLEADATPP